MKCWADLTIAVTDTTLTNILDQYSHMNAVVPPRTPDPGVDRTLWTPWRRYHAGDSTRATVHGRRLTFTRALPVRLVARHSQRAS